MAPLIIGADVRNINRFDLETYTNAEVIEVNQDSLRSQGRRIHLVETGSARQKKSASIWARNLSDDKFALVFLNNFDNAATISCDKTCWGKIGVSAHAKFSVRDLWS